jgi:poly(A) polymerase
MRFIPHHIKLPKDVHLLRDIFNKNNKTLHLVGGAVRDSLLGRSPRDFDFVTDATIEEVAELLSGNFEIIKTKHEFGSLKIRKDSFSDVYDIITFREEACGKIATCLEDDVLRRDFTINSLYYDIDLKKVLDFVGGFEDLRSGVLRTVAEVQDLIQPAEQQDATNIFSDDPNRVLRGIRFASRYGFGFTDKTKSAMMGVRSLSGVKRKKIKAEFLSGISGAINRQEAVNRYYEFGVLNDIFPLLKIDIGKDFPMDPYKAVASMLGGNDPEKTASVLRLLKYTDEESKMIIGYITGKLDV